MTGVNQQFDKKIHVLLAADAVSSIMKEAKDRLSDLLSLLVPLTEEACRQADSSDPRAVDCGTPVKEYLEEDVLVLDSSEASLGEHIHRAFVGRPIQGVDPLTGICFLGRRRRCTRTESSIPAEHVVQNSRKGGPAAVQMEGQGFEMTRPRLS